MWMRFRRSSAVGEPPALDVYDVACLAGGVPRVVDSAVIALAERGLVVVRASRVRAVGADERGRQGAPPPAHPVERALLAACPPEGSRGITRLRAILTRSPEIDALVLRLADEGLVAGARGRSTLAGRRRLAAAERDGRLPAYVFGGAAVLPDGPVRQGIIDAAPAPSGLGRAMIRLGNAVDRDTDSGGGEGDGGGSSGGSSEGSGGGSSGGFGCGGGSGGGD
ncbi:TIGR04222 domain-containing membrane protein [Streptomyces sp. NPDC127108]|uniref:TIGR04222 domain-containing membrane protein n=1 Tax=Streptomyces sp. NPDC127108 TaxID=3345361 RepID=UPI003630E58E